MRRAGLLSALLLTAVLFYMMPGLLSTFVLTDTNRMDPRLRPPESRTLTLWLVGGGMDDGKLLSQLCGDFEASRRGLRVFLRRVDADELTRPDAVLPDGVLYGVGDIVNPEQRFLPLHSLDQAQPDALSAGQSGAVQYAAPLWLCPNVLSVPSAWLKEDGKPSQTLAPDSFFGLSTPAPEAEETPTETTDFSALPWRKMMEPGALWIQPGVAWQQMLMACPAALRGELISASPAQDGCAAKGTARAWRLQDHLAAEKAGEALTALILPPAVSDRVRFLSLCGDNEDARLFMVYLLSPEAQGRASGMAFVPAAQGRAETAEGIQGRAADFFREGMLLPNAFAHTREELASLCRDGWLRAVDPVETLLKLR